MTVTIESMTPEDLEQIFIEHDILATLCGFKNGEEMENYKVDASLGMIKFGDSFTQYLGHALAHADSRNTSKIIISFRAICDEHRELYIKFDKERNEANY